MVFEPYHSSIIRSDRVNAYQSRTANDRRRVEVLKQREAQDSQGCGVFGCSRRLTTRSYRSVFTSPLYSDYLYTPCREIPNENQPSISVQSVASSLSIA